MHKFLSILTLLFWFAASAQAQMQDEAASLYYVVERDVIAYRTPDTSQPYLEVEFREPVYFIEREGLWSKIRTRNGGQGYVRNSAISNVWIRVSKKSQTLYVYKGTKLFKEFPVDLGYNRFADKQKRGSLRERDHWRTPEGTFFVTAKNARSQFYKALVLNYPTAEDAERGLREGLISQDQYAAIVRAEAMQVTPPMNTSLGGWIEIHGNGTGARNNWTQGCIAIRDEDIDALWSWIPVGTPVLIEP